MLKLKKNYCNKTSIYYFILVSNKISLGGKNYKYFIGYWHNDNKVKPLHKI